MVGCRQLRGEANSKEAGFAASWVLNWYFTAVVV
jgi:hypothetical protein